MPQLVLIHGRAQEHKDAITLKEEWVGSLLEGLKKKGLSLPIADNDVRFPYYGQTLFDLREGMPADRAAEVVVRGDNAGRQEQEFLRSVLAEMLAKALDQAIARGDLSPEDVPDVAGSDVIERGFVNWEWVQKGLEWIDANLPGASGTAIALATKDVYDYLRNQGLRDMIESGVRKALVPGEETVVVAHSLGSIVAYNLLRREGAAQGWVVPLFMTVGSPLGIKAIRQTLAPLTYPSVVGRWFNALDPGDVVALYSLQDPWFGVQPPIENYEGVNNQTSNQHGITGYLSDPEVAARIHSALVGDA